MTSLPAHFAFGTPSSSNVREALESCKSAFKFKFYHISFSSQIAALNTFCRIPTFQIPTYLKTAPTQTLKHAYFLQSWIMKMESTHPTQTKPFYHRTVYLSGTTKIARPPCKEGLPCRRSLVMFILLLGTRGKWLPCSASRHLSQVPLHDRIRPPPLEPRLSFMRSKKTLSCLHLYPL